MPSANPKTPGQRPYEPDADFTARHELSHIDADGIACVARRVPRDIYDQIEVQCVALAGDGVEALKFPARYSEKTQAEVAQLGAFGPIAEVDDMASYVRSKEFDALAEKAGLSDDDKALAEAWDGPPLLPLTVCLAVRSIADRLGKGKMLLRAKCLRELSEKQLPFLLLKDYLPYSEAVAAYEEGSRQLKALLK